MASNDVPDGRDVYDDVAVHDVEMLAEIDLLGDLIVIATCAERALSQAEIDTALGVRFVAAEVPEVPAPRSGSQPQQSPART